MMDRSKAGARQEISPEPDNPVRPGPKPSLTLPQIAQAAIQLADSEGLDAVSMERVARQLNVTTMAIYRYLSGKQALIEVMIENAAARCPDFSQSGKAWRRKLVAWMRACSSIYRAHPWLLRAALGPRTMGPNELEWLDSALAILGEAGIPVSEQHEIFLVLIGHVRSSVEFESANQHGRAIRLGTKSAKSFEEFRERLPALAAVLERGGFRAHRNQEFDSGVACLLNGIESLARNRRRGEGARGRRTR